MSEGRTEANNALKPGSPKKKQAALIAEKAMKSHIAKKNDKKKARSSWMVPIAITVAVVAFLVAMQFRGERSEELNGTWWDNEWMDEQEDFSDDISIQQRNREIKMDENKEKRNAKRGSKDKAKEKSKKKKKPSKAENDDTKDKQKGQYSEDRQIETETGSGPSMARDVDEEEKWIGDEEFNKLADKVGCDFTVLSALDRRGNVDKNFQPPAHLFRKKIPFVVRGLSLDWPATNDDSWQRYRLIEKYGNASIPTDSQGAVVFTGGGGDGSDAGKFNTLESVLNKMRDKSQDDSFTFDASIRGPFPSYERTSRTLTSREWLSEDKEKNKDAWHMLSLGALTKGCLTTSTE